MTDLKEWAIRTLFLAIKTAAQTAIGVIGGASLITQVDWALVGSSVLLAFISTFIMHVGDIDIDALVERMKAKKKLG